MEIKGSNKMIIVLVVVLLIASMTAYYLFFKSPAENLVFDEFGNPVAAQVVGQDLINVLNELESVTFDSSLFRTPAFLNLFDFAVTLTTQPQGRANPFDVIGR